MLLCADLGDPDARPLTLRQLQTLGRRARLEAGKPGPEEVTQALLQSWGYEPRMAARIEGLLAREKLLDHYLMGAARLGVSLRTRIDPQYPRQLWRILGQDAPPVLALWGDESLLERPCVSVVGSREPSPREEEFSRQAGRQAAEQGFVLVSGNARGCDRLAQEACLRAGGQVISVVADELSAHCAAPKSRGVLWIGEGGYDLPFSPQRALSRNRIIHALGQKVIAIGPRARTGGTWAGAAENLKKGWSPVFVAGDSEGVPGLESLGASPVEIESLKDLSRLESRQMRIF